MALIQRNQEGTLFILMHIKIARGHVHRLIKNKESCDE